MKLVFTSSKRGRRRRGIFTFEWILLISLLVIGVIGGLTAVRNSLICEMNELTDCIEAIACCDSKSKSQRSAPKVFGFGERNHGKCTTCSVGGNHSGNWWED